MVLMSLQLKCPTALCLTLQCHFVWLINLRASHPPYMYNHLPCTTMGTTPASTTPTQLSDQTQLHVPFISAGAAWPRGSSVNLWSQSIIHSPTHPTALHCHWTSVWQRSNEWAEWGWENRTEDGESEVVGPRNQKPSIYPTTCGHSSLWVVTQPSITHRQC